MIRRVEITFSVVIFKVGLEAPEHCEEDGVEHSGPVGFGVRVRPPGARRRSGIRLNSAEKWMKNGKYAA